MKCHFYDFYSFGTYKSEFQILQNVKIPILEPTSEFQSSHATIFLLELEFYITRDQSHVTFQIIELNFENFLS